MTAQPAIFPSGQSGMWSSVFLLLRLRVRLWFNSFKKAKLLRKIMTILFALVILAFGIGMMVGSFFLLRLLQSPQVAGYIDIDPILAALPSIILTAGFIVILATNFSVLLQALYLSRDMDFLIAAPIPMRAVFLSKMIQAILPNFGLFCLAGLPILFGLAGSKGYNVLFYVVTVLQAAMLALAAGGLASILVMLVVRVVPARRVAEVLGFVGALVTITLSQSGNLMNQVDFNKAQVANVFSRITFLNQPWSPLAWIGHGLVDLGTGVWASGLALTVATLVLSTGIFVISLVSSEKLYYSGWARMQGNSQKRKVSNGAKRHVTASGPGVLVIFPRASRAIIRKDFLLLRRDLRNLSHFISPLIIGFVMLLSTGRGIGAAQDSAGFMQRLPQVAQYANIGLTFFVSWMLMVNLATNSISREGKNYWLLNAAPLKPSHLIVGKFVVSFLPGLVLAWAFILVSSLLNPLRASGLVYSLAVVTLLIFGLNGLLLTFGVFAAKLDWEDVRKQGMRGASGCLGVLASFAYGIIAMALFLGPPALWSLFLPNSEVWIGQAIGLLVGAVAVALVTFIPLGQATRHVPRIGEPAN